MLLGLFIGVQLIEASQRQPLSDTLPTSLVPWMVALPVIDTLRLIFSRLKQGRSPLSPDRTHLHHLLLDKGLSPRLTVIAMLVLADILFWGGFALGQWHALIAGLGFIAIIILSIGFFIRRPL
jgi:UDP-GlcNAc:undecaprenyl-phosphate GlcNAc-1-phosphate transferase